MKRLVYLLFSLALFCACESHTTPSDLPEKSEPKIFVYAFYREEGSSKYPDVGSKVYVYYGICNKALWGYTNNWNGSITDKETGNTIQADQEATIGHNGDALLIPIYLDQMFTLVIESNHYPGRIGSAAYTGRDLFTYGDIKFTAIQTP
jgi:hypothetical protein